jgi:hypothetical protein
MKILYINQKPKVVTRIISIVLTLSIIFSCSSIVFATSNNNEVIKLPTDEEEEILNCMENSAVKNHKDDVGLAIPSRVFNNEEDAGKLPGKLLGIYVEDTNNKISTSTYFPGVGSVVGRVRAWTTASNGYMRTGYKKGTLSAIGSLALAFVPGVGAMVVSAILGAVSLAASDSDVVSGETLITYRYKYRDGEGRWTSDPNKSGYWHLGYRTGQRETFKHVIGGKYDKKTKLWTFKLKNYNKTAAKTEKSQNYKKSDSWLAEQGRKSVLTGNVYVETPW